MSRLMEYFNEVDKNAAMRAFHQLHPVKCMSEFGLVTDEQDAVLSGDGSRLALAIGISMEAGSKFQAIHIPQEIYPAND